MITAKKSNQAVMQTISAPNAGGSVTSGWAISALVAAILFVPLVPLACAMVALRRIRRAQGRIHGRGLAIAALIIGAIQLVAYVLVVILSPFVQRMNRAKDLAYTTQDLKLLGQIMSDFERDWGTFPSRRIGVDNPDSFMTMLNGDDANYYLNMLIAGGYTQSADIFRRHDLQRLPDGRVEPWNDLREPGSCQFGYVMLSAGKAMSNSSGAGRPLLVVSLAYGARGRNPAFNLQRFDGKGVYLLNDLSVHQSCIDHDTCKMFLPNGTRTLFETGPSTVWGDDIPDVKPPR